MSEEPNDPLEVTVEDLEAARRAGALVVDVRQPDEYAAGHVPAARPIPLAEVVERVAEVPTGQPVYIVCHSGGRSLKAARFYRSKGIEAWSVAGGTKEWADSGRPIALGAEPGQA